MDHFVQLILELHLLAQGRHPAFKTQQGHGDFPAIARLANQVVGCSRGLIEKYLVEFTRAGQLPDRLHLYATLLHGYQ